MIAAAKHAYGVEDLVADGASLDAIKMYRHMTGSSFKEAKLAVERLERIQVRSEAVSASWEHLRRMAVKLFDKTGPIGRRNLFRLLLDGVPVEDLRTAIMAISSLD